MILFLIRTIQRFFIEDNLPVFSVPCQSDSTKAKKNSHSKYQTAEFSIKLNFRSNSIFRSYFIIQKPPILKKGRYLAVKLARQISKESLGNF